MGERDLLEGTSRFNLPLAFTGQEAIWQKVFMDFNVCKEDLHDFFGEPAFLAWARMGNLHGWGGPLSQNWLDHQLALQKQILSRMLELEMTPVLPSFSGNVPSALRKIYPSSNITRLGNWNTISGDPRWCCTSLLDPSDPLFVMLGEAFIKQQINGTSCWWPYMRGVEYAGFCFHWRLCVCLCAYSSIKAELTSFLTKPAADEGPNPRHGC